METAYRTGAVLLSVLALSSGVLSGSPSKGKMSSSRSMQATQDDGMTLESFIESGSDETAMFGVDILQEFQFRNLECSLNISKLEHHYQVRMRKLLVYYHGVEKAVKTRNFESLSNHNRQAVERNVQNVMHAAEREYIEKVKQAHKSCDRDISMWLEIRLVESMTLAKNLIRRNPSAFEDLLKKVRLFQSKLYSHKVTCAKSGGEVNSTVTCNSNDLQMLLNFTTVLIGRMNYIRDLYFSDDEDLGRNRLGSGAMEYDEPLNIQDSFTSRSRNTGSIKSTPQASEERHQPPQSQVMPQPAGEPSREAVAHQHTGRTTPHRAPPESGRRVFRQRGPSNVESNTEQPTAPGRSTTEGLNDFKVSRTTSNPTTSKGNSPPTSAATEFHMRSSQQVTSKQSEGSNTVSENSHADENAGPDGELVDFPPSSTQTQDSSLATQPGQETDDESIVILDGPDQPANVKADHTPSSTGHHVLVILAVLVAVVLLAALAIVAVVAFFAVKKRQLHKSGYVRVHLTAETEATNETLEEIRRAGYVNPTYKFYTRC